MNRFPHGIVWSVPTGTIKLIKTVNVYNLEWFLYYKH